MTAPNPKIWVIGASGQLGQMLAKAGMDRGIDLVATGRPHVDFSSLVSLTEAIAKIAPSIVINVAAYTKVDEAEVEPAIAHKCNAVAPTLLAKLCRDKQLPLVHVSTDYVFDGTKSKPYVELDMPNPIN